MQHLSKLFAFQGAPGRALGAAGVVFWVIAILVLRLISLRAAVALAAAWHTNIVMTSRRMENQLVLLENDRQQGFSTIHQRLKCLVENDGRLGCWL